MKIRTEVSTPTVTTDTVTSTSNVLTLGKLHSIPMQVIDMDDDTVTLVVGEADEGETSLTGQLLIVIPNSGGASEILKLPPPATWAGVELSIRNVGGQGVAVQSSAGAAIVTIAAGKSANVACDGTNYGVLAGA